MKPNHCTMCPTVTVGVNGYRCSDCGTSVCRHMGLWKQRRCPDCFDKAKVWWVVQPCDGHALSVTANADLADMNYICGPKSKAEAEAQVEHLRSLQHVTIKP
jgi:hypothetical protein